MNEEGYTTSVAECYVSLLKRGVYGTFDPVSKKHTFTTIAMNSRFGGMVAS
jgi:hypothetical protein